MIWYPLALWPFLNQALTVSPIIISYLNLKKCLSTTLLCEAFVCTKIIDIIRLSALAFDSLRIIERVLPIVLLTMLSKVCPFSLSWFSVTTESVVFWFVTASFAMVSYSLSKKSPSCHYVLLQSRFERCQRCDHPRNRCCTRFNNQAVRCLHPLSDHIAK